MPIPTKLKDRISANYHTRGEKLNFDLVVIGAGPAGYNLAAQSAGTGLKVAVVEKDKPGGVCTNAGCIPSKFLIDIAGYMNRSKLKYYGISGQPPQLDFLLLMQEKNRKVERIRKAIKMKIDSAGASYFASAASINDENTVRLLDGGEILKTANIAVCTGSAENAPRAIPGIACASSPEEFLRGDTVRDSYILIGGGVSSCELASFFSSTGRKVLIVEKEDRLLPFMDYEVSLAVESALKRRGVRVLCKASVERAFVKDGAKGVIVSGAEYAADEIIAATGRMPLHAGLFEKDLLGLAPSEFIKTGPGQETSVSGIYAAGDITGPPFLAHRAYFQSNIIADRLYRGVTHTGGYFPASVVYTDPESASVGLAESRKGEFEGGDLLVLRKNFVENPKAVLDEAAGGFIKLLVSKKRGTLEGASICCKNAGEMIASLTYAVNFCLPLSELRMIPLAHPTYSEMFSDILRQLR